MAKVLQFDAFVTPRNDPMNNLYSLGKFTVGVPVDTGLWSASLASPVQQGQYTFFLGYVDDLLKFGGDVIVGGAGGTAEENVNKVAEYIRFTRPMPVHTVSGYTWEGLALKLVNKVGQFAFKPFNVVGNFYELYNADGTYLRGSSGYVLPLSTNSFAITSNNVQWVGLWVEGFDESGNFSPFYDMYYMTFRGDTRAFTRSKVNDSYVRDARIINFLNNIQVVEDEEDPYGPGGFSGGDTSDGDFDFDGDAQPLDPVPSWVKSGLETGFITLYNPSLAEIRDLASYIWSSGFDLDQLKKLFNNPMDMVLNFGIVPVTMTSAGSKEVGFGVISSGVFMNYTVERYVRKSMGYAWVSRAYGGYLDYAPYTRADLILPFIGVVPIDIDAIMNRIVTIYYNIDVLTGACVAGVHARKDGAPEADNHLIGTYAGNCMSPLPITGADYSTVLSGLIQTAGAIAAGAAAGGGAEAVAGGLSAASAAVVNEGKPMIQKGGAISSAAGFLGKLKPVIIMSIPRQCVPELQISEEGYPAFVSGKIGDASGFVKVYEVHLDKIPASSPELEEIERLLKEGVYV